MAKTNKEEASKEMQAIAKELARHLNLSILKEEVSDFWADKGTPIITYTADITSNIKVEFRYRFGNPRISYWNNEDFAAIELGQGILKKSNGDYIYDGVYRPYETQTWGACGMNMAKMLWTKIEERIHVSTNHFYK